MSEFQVGDPGLRQFYLDYFDKLSQQEFPPDTYELICELTGWCQWLLDKLYGIVDLPENALTEQVQLLGPRLDYFLYTSPADFKNQLIQRSWPSDEATLFIETLQYCQKDLQSRLKARQLERIEVEPGRAFTPGVVNRKEAVVEPTRDPNLHDRIARLDPGDGGYTMRGKVLFPSRAVRYACES